MNAIEDVSLGYVDHSVFFIMLGVSTLIGLYFGCYKRQNTISEYMFGGKAMSVFPISMSILASFVSGVTIIGMPSEVYVYGTQIYTIILGNAIAMFILQKFYLPVICELKFTSYFEYLERRFNSTVRSIGSFLYIIELFLYLPVVIFGSSLSYEQISGISVFKLAPIFCAACILYTSLGGLKAVVCADTLQNVFTMIGALGVSIIGFNQLGGFRNIFETNAKGERLEFFNFDFNPLRRNTFPTVLIGSTVYLLSNFAGNAASYQRFVSLPSYRHASKVATVTIIGLLIITSIVCFMGLMIYTKYRGCDPIITKEVQKADQLISYFTMDVARDYPGVAGLFISGVISASLSTMSTYLNTAALTIYEDFINPIFSVKFSDRKANLIMQAITIILGIACTALIIVVDKLGNLFQVAITVVGVTNGLSLYLFSLGMFVPFANSKGAICGAVASFISTMWIATGAQIAIIQGKLSFPGKLTSIAECPLNSTLYLHLKYSFVLTIAVLKSLLSSTEFGYSGYGTVVEAADDVHALYRISYYYLSSIGVVVAMTVGIIASLLTGRQDMYELDANLIVPQLRFLLPKRRVESYSMVPVEENVQTDGF